MAFEMFLKGRTVTEVADAVGVAPDTASRYKAEYEQRWQEYARANPSFLRDILANTIRSLEELDTVRRSAWDRYENTVSDSIRAQMLNTVLKAQEQRAKLLGVLGVKAEFLALVNNVQIVQNKLLDFMSRELCAADRAKLERFMLTELREYLDVADDTLELEAG
jgi:hypothetical protein